jgi:leucyl-tRNA synthetase
MGVKRFLDKFERYIKFQFLISNDQKKVDTASSKEVKLLINKLIKGVTEDLENFKYNTAIAKMMETLNSISNDQFLISNEDIKTLIKLIAPFAPYTAEELYFNVETRDRASLQNYTSVHLASWPKADPKYLVEEETTIMIAINGKVRDKLIIKNEKLIVKEEILKKAKELESIKKWVGINKIVKEIYIEGKMINLVVK